MLIRRRISVLSTVLALMLASFTLVLAATAHAGDSSNCYTNPTTGLQVCDTNTQTPGGNTGTGTGDGGICMDDNASVDYQGTTYPCSENVPPGHWWYVGGGCYSTRAPASVPLPPPGDPAWDGHTSAEPGFMVYRSCALPPSIANSTPKYEICIGRCTNFGPQYLEQALGLSAPDLRMAPAKGTTGFVNQSVWFWSNTDMSELTKTVTSGANSITGTRTLSSVDWNWGDGTTTHLTAWPDACRPYTLADGGSPAPSGCGHIFAKPSPAGTPFAISVTVQWTYTYSINGGPVQQPAAGQGPKPMTSTATITIIEGQSTNG